MSLFFFLFSFWGCCWTLYHLVFEKLLYFVLIFFKEKKLGKRGMCLCKDRIIKFVLCFLQVNIALWLFHIDVLGTNWGFSSSSSWYWLCWTVQIEVVLKKLVLWNDFTKWIEMDLGYFNIVEHNVNTSLISFTFYDLSLWNLELKSNLTQFISELWILCVSHIEDTVSRRYSSFILPPKTFSRSINSYKKDM